MRDLQRKAVQTWLVGTPGLFMLMLVTGHARRETYAECLASGKDRSACSWRRTVDSESVFYIGGDNWTPTARLIGATTVALVLFSAYLRIWKRPDGS